MPKIPGRACGNGVQKCQAERIMQEQIENAAVPELNGSRVQISQERFLGEHLL